MFLGTCHIVFDNSFFWWGDDKENILHKKYGGDEIKKIKEIVNSFMKSMWVMWFLPTRKFVLS